jgi:hypothetical protein
VGPWQIKRIDLKAIRGPSLFKPSTKRRQTERGTAAKETIPVIFQRPARPFRMGHMPREMGQVTRRAGVGRALGTPENPQPIRWNVPIKSGYSINDFTFFSRNRKKFHSSPESSFPLFFSLLRDSSEVSASR